MGFGAKGSFGFAIAESAMRAFDQKSGAISCKDYGLRSLMMSLSICFSHSGPSTIVFDQLSGREPVWVETVFNRFCQLVAGHASGIGLKSSSSDKAQPSCFELV